jgi:outer membrane protein assembly factor BamA
MILAAWLLIAGVGLSASAQVYFPETITFSGASQSGEQLLAFTGLKPGRVTKKQMQAATDRLTGSGLFIDVRYELNDDVLHFTLTPSPEALPARYDNFPWWDAKTLTALVGEKVPLFGGSLYAGGPMRQQVVDALTQLVAAKGIEAKIGTSPVGDARGTMIATQFHILSPEVVVASLAVEGVGTEQAAAVQKVEASAVGEKFSEETLRSLTGALRGVYTSEGELDASVTEAAAGEAQVAEGRILVPLTARIVSRGAVYTVSAVHFAGDEFTAADFFAAHAPIRAGDVADSELVDETAALLQDPWKANGYEDAVAEVTPALDRESHTVAYTFAVSPGPVYHVGKLTLKGLNKRQERLVRIYWQLPEGAVYRPARLQAWGGAYVKERAGQLALGDGLKQVVPSYETQWNVATHTVDVVVTFRPIPVVPNPGDFHPFWH